MFINAPDSVYDAVNDAAYETMQPDLIYDLTGREYDDECEKRIISVLEHPNFKKFIRYEQCLTVELDLDAGTARVIPTNES